MYKLQLEFTTPDFGHWKQLFDSDPADRQGSGVRHYVVARGVDDPQRVSVSLAFDDLATAQAFKQKLQGVFTGVGKDAMQNTQVRLVEVVEKRKLGEPAAAQQA